MEHILKLAEENQRKAREIVRRTGVVELWKSAGAEVRPVGSLSMGLLMKHRDIDFHLYSPTVTPEAGFRVMARLAENHSVRRVEYVNLLHTEEECVEWHAWCEDDGGELWQLDMIHIRKGSRYDGYFERMAGRIAAVLTDETRCAILRLKYETPEEVKIAGVEYYLAVLRDGVRSYAEFEAWRREHPLVGIAEWMP